MRPIDEELDAQVARLIKRLAIVFALIFIGLVFLMGCASAPKVKAAECRVLSVSKLNEKIADGATVSRWLAWCHEGRYVLFLSPVKVGEVVSFTEYREDDQIQSIGSVTGRK